jgi:hypothetical protein
MTGNIGRSVISQERNPTQKSDSKAVSQTGHEGGFRHTLSTGDFEMDILDASIVSVKSLINSSI